MFMPFGGETMITYLRGYHHLPIYEIFQLLLRTNRSQKVTSAIVKAQFNKKLW